MKIKQAKLLASAVKKESYPYSEFPEVALAGRSNVGKSSLINSVLNRHKLAFTSSKPGKTQTINFYQVNNDFSFVDLPGYGFSKASQQLEVEWGVMIEEYLFQRENLAGIILVVDARHKPTKDDQMMVDWLREVGLPFCVVATKADKVKRGKRNKQEKLIKSTLNLSTDISFFFFSADSGEGKKEVFKFVAQVSK